MVGYLFDSVGSSHFRKIYAFQFFSGQRLHCRPKSRFHNAAGCAKDDACSGRLSQRIVKSFIRQTLEINSDFTDQPCKFPGCNGNIHIRYSCRILIVSSDLEFFRCTWHHTDTNDIFRVNAHLLCIVGLCHRPEHLLRRFTAWQVIQKIREVMLTVFHPSRRTRGHHRQYSAVFHPVKEFMCFFHDRQICAVVCIKHSVKSNPPKRCRHLSFHVGSHRVAKFFT